MLFPKASSTLLAAAFLRLLLLSVIVVNAATATTWREDLPWETELVSKLSSGASLLDTSPANYLEECTPEFQKETIARSNHALIDQPSGLCLPLMFCAFERCSPNPNQTSTTLKERSDWMTPVLFATASAFDGTIVQEWVQQNASSNPVYNLPSKVLFPSVASDVIAAVQFAARHNLEVSVKNSGHHYGGASTKRNTLHINMMRYTQYATLNGVMDCNSATTTISATDKTGSSDGTTSSENLNEQLLDDQPCRLSTAKGKSAVLRVGGGENWDKTYRAVKKSNENNEAGYKYHAVGGAAATVSPMGWTFQGGLSGTTAGRMFGFGVDQVLQLEMVLPNGQHVKFGPTEWTPEEGYDVPKTTKVSGVCRSNPEEQDETKWLWGDCSPEEEINFDDLWFAVRGGGGGTWGVVTSVYLQIHEFLPHQQIGVTFECFDLQKEGIEQTMAAFHRGYQFYQIKFLLDPTSINVTEAQSNACGWPSSAAGFYCYGEGAAQVYDDALRKYMMSNPEEFGLPIAELEEIATCTELTTIMEYVDYAESITIADGEFAGLELAGQA